MRQYRIKDGLFSQHGRVTAKWKRFICFENKKPLFAFFSQFILVCSNWRMCQKRTWYQRILCFIVIFFFNIKHKIGTLLLLSGLFSLVTQVFSIDFTLYLWFVYLIKSSLVHITDTIYWWLTYSYLYFLKNIFG